MKKYILLFAVVIFILHEKAFATHIRAGEITATLVNCNTNTYLITITGYTDFDSDVQFGGGALEFGDGTVIEFIENSTDWVIKDRINDEVGITQFTVEHTYPGPGSYTIRFFERNRNDHVVNMSLSVETPFYIETSIIIDPLLGCNNTPVMEIPPVDRACIGKLFIHNPGAYDVDGDSISYEVVVNKKAFNIPVDNYRYPNDPMFGGTVENGDAAATFSIDTDGNLIWNAPGMAGEYNLAFHVIEWREIEPGVWAKMGYVTRDMQVIVEEDCRNDKPELILPIDTCVEAGTLLEDIIIGIDINGDPVQIESYGEAFSFAQNPAKINPEEIDFRSQPDTLSFSWQTSCDMIREEPYKFSFKITDRPLNGGTPLTDIQIWNVRIVGPKPTGLTVTNLPGGQAQVNWDPYECENANSIQIWRRVDSNPFEPDNCETGLPANSGYELIGTVDNSEISFIDGNDGERLAPGATYCYRLVGIFNDSVESYASDEYCITNLLDAPVITNVSVLETDATNGEILIKWLAPLEIDETLFPPPYLYEVYRGIGFDGGNMVQITPEKISDTEFVDIGLNTQDEVYHYMVYLYDASDLLVDSSAVASSVRLGLASLIGSIQVEWTSNTPWSNSTSEHPWHYIYRDHVNSTNPEELVLIDSVNVLQDGYLYLDDGSSTSQPQLSANTTYCYFVTTSGSYGNSLIPTPLLNDSQISCARPNDTIPPCEPPVFTFSDFNSPDECVEYVENISNSVCDFDNYSNTLSWSADFDEECDQEIRGFKIFFSETGAEDSYVEIAEVRDTFFIHDNLPSFAGCYKIASVDRSGNISALSEALCKDNCPVYELPNLFTPNGDEDNELFHVMKCPWFVEYVTIKIFNRWGVEVYNNDNDNFGENRIYINWDGTTNQGEELPAGVYYYIADVKYIALDPNKSTYQIKGWVHLLK